MIIYILLGLIVLIALYLVSFYNTLATLKVRINASIQEIGNQLKRQSGLIPNLVESVKGYMTHEKDIFTMLTDARKLIDNASASQDPAAIDKAQAMITKALGAIRVVVENNPQLQAATLVTDLMNELRDTADKVMYARRTLIDLAADFNIRIATFPGNIFAPLFGFTAQKGLDVPVSGEFLEVTQSETATPTVKL